MIKAELIKNGSCDNCNRTIKTVKYSMYDKNNNKPYNTISLCEDCTFALKKLFNVTSEKEKTYIYNLDEFESED